MSSYATAIELALCITAVGLLINCLESQYAMSLYDNNGLLTWRVLRTQHVVMLSRWLAPILDSVFGERGYRLVVWLGALASLATLVLYVYDGPLFLPVCVMLIVQIAMMYRSMYGRNGADHMRLIVLAGGAASLVPGIGANVVAVCAWFIAVQVVMSYAIAGWAKLVSSDWRSGNAVIGVLYTESYGTRPLGVYLKQHRWLAYAACWGVIVMECLWIGFFLYDAQVALMLMIAAGLFHLASAIGMGLSDFLLAWGATYPVLWACSGRGAELVATIHQALIG